MTSEITWCQRRPSGEAQGFVWSVLGKFQFNPKLGAKELPGKIAQPFGGGDRLTKNAPRLFFHRYSVMGRADAQTRDGIVVQFSNAQVSHFILLACYHMPACEQKSSRRCYEIIEIPD